MHKTTLTLAISATLLFSTALEARTSTVAYNTHSAHAAETAQAVNTSSDTAAQSKQTTPQHNVKTLQQITVTGSRIPESEVSGAQPTIQISRKQIVSGGSFSIGGLLQRLSVSGAALNGQSDYSTGNGATRIDLRYLGASRTLVLLNGHRMTPGSAGLGLQTELSEAPDLSVIPSSVVQNIEVLKDGASAVYGSDAIAGVINIITKKNYNGAEASAYYGCYQNYGCDGKNQKYNMTVGHTWEGGSIIASLTYQKSSGVNSAARAITRSVPGTGNLFLGTGFKGQYDLVTADGFQNLTANNATGYVNPLPRDFHTISDHDLNQNGLILPPYSAPQKLTNVYLQGFENIGTHAKFNSSVIYSKRKSFDIAGYAAAYLIGGSFPSALSAPLVIPVGNQFNPYPYNLVANGPDPSKLGATSLLFTYDRNALDTYAYDATYFQYSGGPSGYFDAFGSRFDWDVNFTYGNEREDVDLGGAMSSINLRNALGPSSNCGPGSANPACVPYNLFGPNTQAASNYFFYTSPSANSESQTTLSANISSGDIADLPGGPLGFAAGVQRLRLYGDTTIDPLRVDGISDFVSTEPSSGGYSVRSVYGEVRVPLLRDLPGANRLAVDLQTRHEQYSTFGGNTSSRVMFTYNPVSSLLLRGTWSQGFRAPGLNDLFVGPSESFPPVVDPCLRPGFASLSAPAQQRCLQTGASPGGTRPLSVKPGFITEGNVDIQPETSISRTFGIVWSPKFISRLSVNADYYKIGLNHAIETLAPQDVLNGCYVGGNELFCNEIQRAKATGTIFRVTNGVQNIGSIATGGIDYGVKYQLPETRIGNFAIGLSGTRIKYYNETTPNFNGNGGTSTQRLVGVEQGGITFPQGVPENKYNIRVDWSRNNWAANWELYYIGSVTGPCSNFSTNGTASLTSLGLCNEPDNANPILSKSRMPAVVYNDAFVSYTIHHFHTTLSFGVNNIFNRATPVCYSCSFNFDPTMYRIPGRYTYIRVETRL